MLDRPGKQPPGGKPTTQVPGDIIRPLPTPKVPTDELVPGTDNLTKGKILQDQGMLKQALAEFEKAISENPLLTGAYMGAGEVHMKQGNLEKAEVNYSRAVEIEPRNFDAQFLHAVVLQELNRLSESIRAYLRALNLRPDDFQANVNLGAAYLQSGEPQQSLAYAKHAVELRPDDGAARANLGVVYQSLGRHEEAITEFLQSAELAELTPELLTNLADSYGRVKRYEEMVATLEQVVELKPAPVAFERLGSGQFRLGLYDEALTSFRASARLDPKHYPAHNGVGVCLLHQWIAGDRSQMQLRDEGLRALRESLRIERNQPKVMELLTRYR
jgi:tetratricopeptide (TPR) repeat protein